MFSRFSAVQLLFVYIKQNRKLLLKHILLFHKFSLEMNKKGIHIRGHKESKSYQLT